jgi:murein DD-endopeptidase MepM/ murein hydrolase activator NlpD
MAHRSVPHRRHVVHPFLAMLAVVLLPSGAGAATPCWAPPVEAAITDPFRAPACRWCPGNRGLEYGTRSGDPVRAVAAGRVTFAGAVARVRYAVVEHADGRRVTYGGLASVLVAAGDRVVRGARIGTAAGPLHLGVRDGDRYVDPEPFIGEWRGVTRLIPTDSSAAAPAPPPRLVCERR